MKIVFGLLLSLTVNMAWAGEYLFKVKEYDQPHMLKLVTSENNSRISFFQLYDSSDGKVLFELKGKESFEISTDVLDLNDDVSNDSDITFEDVVEGLTCVEELRSNPWGDTAIVKTDTYTIFIKLVIANNTVVGGRLEIANNDVEEMALWGDLIPVN